MTAPVLVIAEAGVNHNGDVTQAIALVRAAKQAGADIVKFQHFTSASLVAAGAGTVAYQLENAAKSKQADLLGELELTMDEFALIARSCREAGIGFLCTAFDPDAIDGLIALGMSLVKIPSGELTNLPLLRRYGGLGLPILLSTGMGTMDEVGTAVGVLRSAGSSSITLLQCTSLYPAPAETLNLRAMISMADRFRMPVGFSDHSIDDFAAIAAVALGAGVIEKHLTLDRNSRGPDHKASMEPREFGEMVRRLRLTALALGDGVKRPAPDEAAVAQAVRRSWHASRDLPGGLRIESADVILKRPASGLPPVFEIVGRRLRKQVMADSPITADCLEL